MRTIAPILGLFVLACVPAVTTPISDIPKLESLEAVMHNQATTADPQFGKIDQGSYSDEEFASFAETATRIDALSLKIKDFSKGADFDTLADKLNASAKALATAAENKNQAAANGALKEMKATCKSCHSLYR